MRTLILRASPVNFHTQPLYTAIPSTRLQSTPSQSQLRNCSQNVQLPPIIQNHLPALEDVVTYDIHFTPRIQKFMASVRRKRLVRKITGSRGA